MLTLTRKSGETIAIYPSENIDPNMTVGELFKNGMMDIKFDRITNKVVTITINAPADLTVVRSELL